MKTAGVNHRHHRQLAALCAILALTLTLIQGVAPTTASASAADEPDIRNEERVLDKYFNDLVSYRGEIGRLQRKASLQTAEIDPVQRKSDDLKRRLSEVQNAFREIIKKLKASGKWDDLDKTALANTTDSDLRTQLQQEGLKKLLEDAASNLTSDTSYITAPLDKLRQRATAHGAPNPVVMRRSLACRLGAVRMGLISALGGKPTNATLDTVSCACHPDKDIGIGTGTPCTDLTQ
jgi:hypothetical protein